MKKILMLMVVLLMGIQWNSGYALATKEQAETGSNPKVIYVPKEQISVSKSVEEDTFTVFRNIRKNAAWGNTDDFFNDCSTNYAFLQLENREKSFELKTLYIEILNAFTEVYGETDKDIPLMNFSEKQLYCIGEIPYSALGLDYSEAFDVFMRVLADHPLLYFVKEMLVQDGCDLYLIASEEFYKGDVRREYNSKIQSAITGLASDTESMKSNYEIVKYVHDLVIGEVDYAYEEGTATPKNNDIVHSMAGYVSDAKEVVCDGYTETMAAMLNYLDIESICAYGWGVKQGELTSTKTAHAWNIVKLGNGKYYAVDATWDDTESEGTYTYFCLGRKIYESHSIIRNDHEEGTAFHYDMPELPADDFIGEDILLNTEDPVYAAEAEIDSVGEYQGFSYEMDQYGAICLTGYQGNEKVVKVPSDIKGHRVVSITNCFNYNDVIEEIELPDTIYYIGFVGCNCSKLEKLTINTFNPGKDVAAFTYMDGIFGSCQNLKTIIVNENENFKTFWAEDNVLYFGEPDNITLVLYPAGKTDKDYHFHYAMQLGSAFQENKYIRNVIFEEEIKDTLMDGTVDSASHVFYHCTGLESVTLQKGGPTVMSDWFDGCVSLKSFEIPDTVTKIGSMMFNGCISLKEIVIPSSVTYIESTAFQGCSALESCTIYNDEITFEHIVIDGKEEETIWNGCNKLVLYCNTNSNTEKYARKFNIMTAPIGSKITVPDPVDSNLTPPAPISKYVQITFHSNGGKKSTANKNVITGGVFGSLPKPTKKNYTFIGWYTARKGGKKITETAKVDVIGNITLYAHWKKVTVKKTAISFLKRQRGNRLSVKWKKVSGAEGYRITYSWDKKFKTGKKSIVCSPNNYFKILKKLGKGKTCYIKVQAYKVDSAGNKIYGSCKKIMSIKMM